MYLDFTPRQAHKGTVIKTDTVVSALSQLAKDWPVGARVHRVDTDLEGTVRVDEPVNVPGIHTGEPGAWCVTDLDAVYALVCVAWETEIVPVLAWVPTSSLSRASGSPRPNRPAPRSKGSAR
jgi:hypothetical protein